jgi:hypothetical protein
VCFCVVAILTDKHCTWSTQISEISLNCKHVNLVLPLVKIWKRSIMGSWHGSFKDNDRAKWMVFPQFGQPHKEGVVGLTCFRQFRVWDLFGLYRWVLQFSLYRAAELPAIRTTNCPSNSWLRRIQSLKKCGSRSFQLLSFYHT